MTRAGGLAVALVAAAMLVSLATMALVNGRTDAARVLVPLALAASAVAGGMGYAAARRR